jgi:hypothetical protein
MNYFPFPSIIKGRFQDGILQTWPETCRKCEEKHCSNPDVPQMSLQACKCGMSYVKISEELTVGGMAISAERPEQLIHLPGGGLNVSINDVVSLLTPVNIAFNAKVQSIKLWENGNTPRIPANLREQTFFIESYRNLVRRILQDIKLAVEETPEVSVPNDTYKNIFWRCKYFIELLSAFEFICDPVVLVKTYKCIPLRISTFVKTQITPVSFMYRKKSLKFSFFSDSSKLTTAYPKVISALIFIFLDNAAKYAPPKSNINISVKDQDDGVEFSVTSLGPEIHEDENTDIYTAGYRGKAVRYLHGSGLGLFIARLLAEEHLKTSITHSQEKRARRRGHKTTFSINIPEKAGILF